MKNHTTQFDAKSGEVQKEKLKRAPDKAMYEI
jgi:hypothetical protein